MSIIRKIGEITLISPEGNEARLDEAVKYIDPREA